ncbi:hypothetical protein [Streptomyces flavidovirens]|uniref:hypothetical protein n=1 Tax=Streptomyces flavidovirens TaxID=67298 RepID=UPI0012FF51AC|nr:hypothetical protein [Streptomyces flavidovirens]
MSPTLSPAPPPRTVAPAIRGPRPVYGAARPAGEKATPTTTSTPLHGGPLYFGPASQPVEVVLPPGGLSERAQRNDHAWAPPRTTGGRVVRTHPVRDAASAPAGLKATVKHANGIHFTWTDHAADEEAQLLEIRPAGSRTFRPAAVLGPGVDSFGLITLPDEKKASYRIRAIAYGEQSNDVRLKTGARPTSSATPR